MKPLSFSRNAIETFLADQNWQSAKRFPLAADASERRYTRLQRDNADTCLLVQSGEQATMRDTSTLTDILLAWDFSAPKIHAWDEKAGLMLIEDFGTNSYRQALANGTDQGELYRLAIDTLIALEKIALRKITPRKVAPGKVTPGKVTPRKVTPGKKISLPLPIEDYRKKSLFEEQEIFLDWHCPAWKITITPEQRKHYNDIWEKLLDHACHVPPTLILRDFHIDNLFHLPQRQGVKACGLIDFQDARIGPCTYDFISLVHDVRHPIVDEEELYSYFFHAYPHICARLLRESCTVLSCHRLCKIAGIFVRLEQRDGKIGYRSWLPRTWELLKKCLAQDIMTELRQWFDDTVPAPCRTAPPPAS